MKETDYEKLGEYVVNFLNLKVKKNGKIPTQWGDKTLLGLGLCFKHIMTDFDNKELFS